MCGKSKAVAGSTSPVLGEGVVAHEINGETFYFKLSKRYGDLYLTACNANGTELDAGLIVGINHEGTLHRYSGIKQEAGVKLTGRSRIKTNKDY